MTQEEIKNNPLASEQAAEEAETPTTEEGEAPHEDDERVKLKQELDGSTRENELYREAVKIYQDPKAFVKLYERSPKIAQKVADKFFDAVDAKKTYERLINENPEVRTALDDGLTPEQRALRIYEQKEAEKTFKTLLKENNIDLKTKFGKEFLAEYEDRTEGKQLTSENIEKYFSKTLREVKGVSKYAEEYENNLKGIPAIGATKGPAPKTPPKTWQPSRDVRSTWKTSK